MVSAKFIAAISSLLSGVIAAELKEVVSDLGVRSLIGAGECSDIQLANGFETTTQTDVGIFGQPKTTNSCTCNRGFSFDFFGFGFCSECQIGFGLIGGEGSCVFCADTDKTVLGHNSACVCVNANFFVDSNGLCQSKSSSRARRRRAQLILDPNSDAAKCPSSMNPCPLGNSALSTSYECLNTQEELTACGSCDNDCTQLPGVNDVGCGNGRCQVFTCLPGFSIHPDGGSCISQQRRFSQ